MKSLFVAQAIKSYSTEGLMDKAKKANDKLILDPRDLPEDWDQYCEDGYKYVVEIRLFKKYWATMRDLLLPQPNAIILDGGCGTGAMFPMILENFWPPKKIVAVDWSRKMLHEAKKTATKLIAPRLSIFGSLFNFERQDLSQLYPWPDNNFDAQVYSITLYYLPHRGWEIALKESYRTIKPGGYIYASIMFKGWDFPAMIKKNLLKEFLANPYRCVKAAGVRKTARKFHAYAEQGIIEYPSREEFLAFLVNLGFKIEAEEGIFQGGGMAVRAKKIDG
ncbi:MAG: methyltransferase domain-containing protein [bacterium]